MENLSADDARAQSDDAREQDPASNGIGTIVHATYYLPESPRAPARAHSLSRAPLMKQLRTCTRCLRLCVSMPQRSITHGKLSSYRPPPCRRNGRTSPRRPPIDRPNTEERPPPP